MNVSRAFELDPKPGCPSTTWWAEAEREHFTARCEQEWQRMRGSKEHARMGLPMVVGAIDGKGKRTS